MHWGFVLGQTLCFASGVRQTLAFLDTNMLVSPTQVFTLGEPPSAKISFASQCNIGFKCDGPIRH